MMNHISKRKITILAAAIGITLLAAGFYSASANDQSVSTSCTASDTACHGKHKPEMDWTQKIQSFKDNGTITQTQADSLQEYASSLKAQMKTMYENHKNSVSTEKEKLISTAGLTQEQADQIFPQKEKGLLPRMHREASPEGIPHKGPHQNRKEAAASYFQIFVDKGIITSDQASALKTEFGQYQTAQREEMKTAFLQMKAEREAAAQKAGVSAEVMDQIFAPHRGMHRFFSPQEQAQRIQSFVDKGTITRSQADKLTAAMEQRHEAFKTAMEQHRAFFNAQKNSLENAGISDDVIREVFRMHHRHFQAGGPGENSPEQNMKSGKRPDIRAMQDQRIQELKTQGTITQDQADLLSSTADKLSQERKTLHESMKKDNKTALSKETGISKDVLDQIFPMPPHHESRS